ncbi:MAG: imidazole glycerol phosphate synthase subunit HisF [Candidatus Fluviicola riflensis]|nr:MAG: imidazole glycerol phosphate synthase subunit HisF [Candidatus Fluviicola riflensis]OGS79667.1 MAG: imidazole glycerol phosphate synthase subunit HisF [Candidatus Fluviicola riflensis]OGS87099.1 MAG: imidazole glycerol phosphate synthase subunit HisF [Fluviicola sp. RIFCSPHIGHO2_01_FULL_43_53]OGS89889.1 MAG: imidazole glycerol phosphate synthase subunit HisF [Fluviicola sp. RIFCSPHIGHO2_12_FULL_43_24]
MDVYKRIIPCLDIQNGRTVKGINFESIRDAGDPVELAKLYAKQGADELVLLDISATIEERSTFLPIVEAVAAQVDIPFTVGGGIASVETAFQLLRAGADKISVNSSAILRQELITELSSQFGKQCVVVAIDIRKTAFGYTIHTHGGKRDTGKNALEWIEEAVRRGAGELLITSMDGDGTKNGFALDFYKQVSERVNVPVIASGGAGTAEHFEKLFNETSVTGGLAASIFHYGEIPIPELKQQLKQTIRIR